MEPKHILVVDDELSAQVLLQKLLVSAHYRVTAVGDGRAALRMIRAEKPDLVILDLVMPGLDGYQVCKMLKHDGSFWAPILIVSGRAKDKDVQVAMEAGADGFIHKPLRAEELLAKVEELLAPKTS